MAYATIRLDGCSISVARGVSNTAALHEMSHCGRDLVCVIPSSRWDVEEAAHDLHSSPPFVTLSPLFHMTEPWQGGKRHAWRALSNQHNT